MVEIQQKENQNITMSNILRKTGYRIAELRKRLGLSQEKFAEVVGISKNYLGNIELGKQAVTLIVLEMITDKLEISLSDFFKDI